MSLCAVLGLATLLAFSVWVGDGRLITSAATDTQKSFTQIATIDLEFNTASNQYALTYAFGGMFYTVQKNQTLVVVNLISGAVAYDINLPHSEPVAMAASKSGHLAVSVASGKTLIFDDKGSLVSKVSTVIQPPAHQMGLDSLVFAESGGDQEFLSLNLKTGQQTVLLKGDFFSADFPEGNATTVVLTEFNNEFKIFEYNYETNETSWVINDLNTGTFKGQDATRIFVSNLTFFSNGSVADYLLVFNKATLKKEAQLGPYYGGLLLPVVHNGLINFVYGVEPPYHLAVVNISTRVVVKEQSLPPSALVVSGTHLVSWGSTVFSVFTYPGGTATVNKAVSSNACCAYIATALPGTDLVAGTFNTKMEVRNLTTGDLVYEQPLANPQNVMQFPPRVLAEQRLMVVTNGERADVFQF